MHEIYAIASPELVVVWMGAIILGAAIPAVTSLVRTVAVRRQGPIPSCRR